MSWQLETEPKSARWTPVGRITPVDAPVQWNGLHVVRPVSGIWGLEADAESWYGLNSMSVSKLNRSFNVHSFIQANLPSSQPLALSRHQRRPWPAVSCSPLALLEPW
jgi:hypothetical protein